MRFLPYYEPRDDGNAIFPHAAAFSPEGIGAPPGTFKTPGHPGDGATTCYRVPLVVEGTNRARPLRKFSPCSAFYSATVLALALLVLARPVDRTAARRVRLVVGREAPLADLKGEVEAADLPLERIVVHPGARLGEDDAELVLGKGAGEGELISLIEGLRGVSGIREVDSVLENGSTEAQG